MVTSGTSKNISKDNQTLFKVEILLTLTDLLKFPSSQSPKNLWLVLILVLVSFLSYSLKVLAQITPDNTLPNNSIATPDGNLIEITGGTTRGTNLFHSFQDFSVLTGQTAFFNNGLTIENILTRVTGSSISNIDGLIRANGNANLFLINPNGIIFGKNASLNIGGSFYGSTADSILFPNDIEFSAKNPEKPLLTINRPIGLGLGDNPGEIVNRSNLSQTKIIDPFDITREIVSGLEVNTGKNITLVGGDITLDGGRLNAPEGAIRLGGLSAAGTVGIDENGDLSFPEDVTQGDITLSNGADVYVNGTGGGSITINARNLDLEGFSSDLNAGITADSTSTDAQAGDITINVTDNVTLDDSSISNQVASEAVGNAGNIIINTGSLFLINGGNLNASTSGKGNAGSINITATEDVTFDGSSPTINGFASGIGSQIISPEAGNGGGITINARNLTLNEGLIIANSFGQGNASSTTTAVGSSKGVNITTDRLLVTNGGQIVTPTFGQADAGDVNITASTEVSFDGFNPFDGRPSGIFTLVNNAENEGNGGEININTELLSLSNNAVLVSNTNGIGDAGNITINADNVSLTNGADILSESKRNVQGDAGDITINASGTVSLGGGSIFVDGEESPVMSSISSRTFGQGNGGNISISAESISLNNAFISAEVTEDLAIDSELFLFDAQGNLLAENDDSDPSLGGEGGTNQRNSFIEFNFPEDGTYTIGVGTFDSSGEQGIIEGNPVFSGRVYTLQVSLEDHPVSGDSNGFLNKIEPNDTPETAQNIDTSFSNNPNPNIQASETIPYVSISAIGDGTFDYYSFTATEGSLGIFDIDEISPNTEPGNVVGGDISLNATGDITLDNESSISAATVSRGQAGKISISTPESIVIRNSTLEVSSTGQGSSGDLSISAGNLILEDRGLISSATNSGNGGMLNLNVNNILSLRDDSKISAEVSGAGIGGKVIINTDFLDVNNRGVISASTSGEGNAGDITVNATEVISLTDNSQLTVETSGAGKPGDIIITTPNLTIGKDAEISATATEISTNTEGGGSITVNASKLDLTGKLGIFAETQGVAPAGTLDIQPDNNKPNLDIQFTDTAIISASTTASGTGGDINLTAPETININGQGKVTVETRGTGDAGSINITTQNFNISDRTEISASTFSSGKAGDINITANNFNLREGATVITNSASSGRAGDIQLKIRDNLNLISSNIEASTTSNSTGRGGNINIDPQSVILQNGATIAVNSDGSGQGGNITLAAEELTLDNGSITAETASNQGGNITLNIGNILRFENSGEITASAGTAREGGDGGNVNINADFILAFPTDNNYQITANAFQGDGGNIQLTTNSFFGSELVDISASSALGLNGDVSIEVLEIDPAKSLIELPTQVVDASQLIAQRCLAEGKENEFVVTGRGGLPANPHDTLRGDAVLSAEWLTLPQEELKASQREQRVKPSTTEEIIEAKGWFVDANGKIILTANPNPIATLKNPWVIPHFCNL